MLHLKREALKIRRDLDKLDQAVTRTEGYADCAETNDREIRAIRSLIFEAAQAYDAMLRYFDGTIYLGMTDEEKQKPIVPFGDDLNDCPNCRAFHASAYNGGGRGHRSDADIARAEATRLATIS